LGFGVGKRAFSGDARAGHAPSVVGAALLCGSPLVLLYIVFGILLWNYVARPWEEFDLERRFGAPYIAYRNAVRCWIPRRRAYRGAE
jgi:protein-S-isoprenylcysteine O-methyltransferase Ste14